LLGAVDVRNGAFKAFDSRKGEIKVEAALASAALPRIFKAVGERYWDGLFSQNPPVRNFTAGSEREGKPEEIWVVQLNPQAVRETLRSASQIEDRRNELAGNLSLNQEVDAIEAVNGWLTDETFTSHGRDRYRPIGVHRIVMDSSSLEPPGRWTERPRWIAIRRSSKPLWSTGGPSRSCSYRHARSSRASGTKETRGSVVRSPCNSPRPLGPTEYSSWSKPFIVTLAPFASRSNTWTSRSGPTTGGRGSAAGRVVAGD
jgi:hypothetical protein